MSGIYPYGDGAWRIHVYAGRDPVTGKQHRITKVVRGSRKDAELARARLLVDATDGHRSGGDGHTLGEAIDLFLTRKSPPAVAATTADTYRASARYVTDHLRAMPLAKLGVEHLDALYAHLAARGHRRTGGPLSGAALGNVHNVIRGSLELARKYRWITVNPALDAEFPRGPRRLPSPAPADAIEKLLTAAALEHPALPTYLRVTLCAGGRRSEIHGLRWGRVDFDRGAITLSDTVVYAAGKWQVKPHTKTGRPRVVHLDPGTVDGLRTLHAQALDRAMACGVSLPPSAFVFSDAPVGETHWVPRTTANRWKRTCARAGVDPTTRLHDLRHLMATHLLDRGVPLPVVAARLGHDLTSTTLDVYGGRVDASDTLAAEVMGRLLDGGD